VEGVVGSEDGVDGERSGGADLDNLAWVWKVEMGLDKAQGFPNHNLYINIATGLGVCGKSYADKVSVWVVLCSCAVEGSSVPGRILPLLVGLDVLPRCVPAFRADV
jgi:hypothetical protein